MHNPAQVRVASGLGIWNRSTSHVVKLTGVMVLTSQRRRGMHLVACMHAS